MHGALSSWNWVQWEPNCSMRTDGRKGMTKLTFAFRNFAKSAHKRKTTGVTLHIWPYKKNKRRRKNETIWEKDYEEWEVTWRRETPQNEEPPIPIQSIPLTYFCKIHFNITLPPAPRFPKWSLSLRVPNQHAVRIYTCHMPNPSHSSCFDHPNNIGWGVQIIKLTVMQLFPTSSLLSSNIFLSTLQNSSMRLNL
jgi:hypothetical protein